MARTFQDGVPWSDSCEVLHAHTMPWAVAHIDKVDGSQDCIVSAQAFANAMTKADVGHTGFSAIRRHNRKLRRRLAMYAKFTIERNHQVEEIFGAGQAGTATGYDLCLETELIPKSRWGCDVSTSGVFIHGLAGKAIDAIPTAIPDVEHAKLSEILAALDSMKKDLQQQVRREIFLNNMVCEIGCNAVIQQTPPDLKKLADAFEIWDHPFLGFDVKEFPEPKVWLALAVPTWIDALDGAGLELGDVLTQLKPKVDKADELAAAVSQVLSA